MLKITIITTTYNSTKTVRDTLESVRRQTYPNIEHIVVDGGSKDDTLNVVKNFSHVKKVISERDYGVYDAMNKGISLATGDVIGFLNSDDIYADDSVIERIAHVFESKNVDSLYSDLDYFESSPQNVVRSWISGLCKRKRFLFGWMPPHPTFYAKKSVYDRFGKFDLTFKQAADYEIMLRFLYRHGITTHYLQGVSVKMRVGGLSNASFKNRWQAHEEDQFAWKKNALKPYFFTVWMKPLAKLEQFKSMYRGLRVFKSKTKILYPQSIPVDLGRTAPNVFANKRKEDLIISDLQLIQNTEGG
jgi:glycosyltransferase involved in cell wall biosynthesis